MEVVTYTKANRAPEGGNPVTSFVYGNKPLRLLSNDDIPFIFCYDGKLLGGMKINLDDTLGEKLYQEMSKLIKGKKLAPEKFVCYFGPAIGFSHISVTRELQMELIEKGFQLACKRTSGEDYLDLGVMNLLMLRKLGIPMLNIHISDYGTADDPKLLYSQSNGEEKENVTIATLL